MPLPASIPTQAYRKAFDLYLRRGIPIELPLKAALQEHPTAHFYFGGGKAVELANIGHLQDVIDRANERRLHPHQVFEGVEAQVCNNARAELQGIISDTFAGTYNFRPVSFVHRISTVKGSFTGSAQKENDYLIISADVSYEFSDIFTGPLDIIQLITGTPKELFAFTGKLAMARNLNIETILEIYKQSPKRNPDDIFDWI